MRRFPFLMILLLFAPAFTGCEETETVVVPDPVPQSITAGEATAHPAEESPTEVDVTIDRGSGIDGGEPREERRGRLRDALDDINVDVDADGTDVRVDDGQVDIDSE